jgi:sortase A
VSQAPVSPTSVSPDSVSPDSASPASARPAPAGPASVKQAGPGTSRGAGGGPVTNGEAGPDGAGAAGAASGRPVAAQVAARVLALACAALLLFAFNLGVVSQAREYFTQNALYGQLRLTLAEGATPVGPLTTNAKGQQIATANGTPVAVMNAPSVGLSNAVVVQGSGGAQTMMGVAHVPDTVLPCQAGIAVLMARNGSYGGLGLGAKWTRLAEGDELTFTMGQGSCTYRVLDQRLAGQLAPAAPAGTGGSLVLVTAEGRPFMPTGVLRIDATLVTKSFAPPAQLPASAVPASENPMGMDTSQLNEAVLLCIVLLAAAAAAAWAWIQWGRWQTWIVAGPVLFTLGLLIFNNINLLLPNLL